MIFTVDEQTKSVKMKLEPEELELAKTNPESFKILMDTQSEARRLISKNVEVICDNFDKEELDCLETIAKRFIKLDSDETSEEDSAREENFKKFLSENL